MHYLCNLLLLPTDNSLNYFICEMQLDQIPYGAIQLEISVSWDDVSAVSGPLVDLNFCTTRSEIIIDIYIYIYIYIVAFFLCMRFFRYCCAHSLTQSVY